MKKYAYFIFIFCTSMLFAGRAPRMPRSALWEQYRPGGRVHRPARLVPAGLVIARDVQQGPAFANIVRAARALAAEKPQAPITET